MLDGASTSISSGRVNKAGFKGFIWAAGFAAARLPAGGAGPSTPAGVPTAAVRLVRYPLVEDSLNESPPLYGGDPNILILRTTGHTIQL